jgi:hypothetical protein
LGQVHRCIFDPAGLGRPNRPWTLRYTAAPAKPNAAAPIHQRFKRYREPTGLGARGSRGRDAIAYDDEAVHLDSTGAVDEQARTLARKWLVVLMVSFSPSRMGTNLRSIELRSTMIAVSRRFTILTIGVSANASILCSSFTGFRRGAKFDSQRASHFRS